MREELAELVEMSNRYGSDPAYVLAGGGNTSAKVGAVLYVKGSGTSLATIKAEDFVSMDRNKLSEMLSKIYPDTDAEREAAALEDLMASRLPENGTKRPSVETLLHNLFPFKYVLHVHPALINGLTCSKGAEERAHELFGDEFVWIPIYRPGYALATLCAQRLAEYKKQHGRDAQILLLQNHGIFVAADTIKEIDELIKHIMDGLENEVRRQPVTVEKSFDPDYIADISEKIAKVFPEGMDVEFTVTDDMLDMFSSPEKFEALEDPFTPDHIVYCKSKFIYLDDIDDLKEAYDDFVKINGFVPRVLCLKNIGAFFIAPTEHAATQAKELFKDAVKIAVYTQSFGGWQHMTPDLIDFITNWEVESYRSSVSGA